MTSPTPAQSDAAATPERKETCGICGAWQDEPCPRVPCDYQPHSKLFPKTTPAATPLTYGELMMLCEGHGTSAIYERILAERSASSAAVEEMRRERDEAYEARDEATTVSLKEVERRMEAEQSVTRLKQELGEARACIRGVPNLTGDYSLNWPKKHAAAIAQSQEVNRE